MGVEGEPLGIVSLSEALAKAEETDIDLVEIAPQAVPPVCRLDYQIKVRNLTRFLQEGDKAKITLRFRGREITHQEFGLALLKRVEADLAEYAVVEQFPKMEGRQMVMVLGPHKKAK